MIQVDCESAGVRSTRIIIRQRGDLIMRIYHAVDLQGIDIIVYIPSFWWVIGICCFYISSRGLYSVSFSTSLVPSLRTICSANVFKFPVAEKK